MKRKNKVVRRLLNKNKRGTYYKKKVKKEMKYQFRYLFVT
jgi:hypothetical protein